MSGHRWGAQHGDTLHVIKSGRGEIYSTNGAGKEIVFAFGPGDTLGEPSLDGGPRSASVMTNEPTTCLSVPIRAVEQLMLANPRSSFQVVRNPIRLLRASIENLRAWPSRMSTAGSCACR